MQQWQPADLEQLLDELAFVRGVAIAMREDALTVRAWDREVRAKNRETIARLQQRLIQQQLAQPDLPVEPVTG